MNLFTDDHPETTVKNLKFRDKKSTIESIRIIESHFNKLYKKQKINEYSLDNLRPKKYIDSIETKKKYYYNQKLYRILGLLNRCKVVYKNHPNKDLKESMLILSKWTK